MILNFSEFILTESNWPCGLSGLNWLQFSYYVCQCIVVFNSPRIVKNLASSNKLLRCSMEGVQSYTNTFALVLLALCT